MSKYLVVVLVCLGLTLSGCDGGGGHGGPPPDPCAGGPVPCFDEDWGFWAYVFEGRETVVLYTASSNGEYAEVWWSVGLNPGPSYVGVGGSATGDCYNFDVSDYGELWYECRPDTGCGYYLYEYGGAASGNIEICAEELRISDLYIFGKLWGDEVADYWMKYQVSLQEEGAAPMGPGRLLRDKLLE